MHPSAPTRVRCCSVDRIRVLDQADGIRTLWP